MSKISPIVSSIIISVWKYKLYLFILSPMYRSGILYEAGRTGIFKFPSYVCSSCDNGTCSRILQGFPLIHVKGSSCSLFISKWFCNIKNIRLSGCELAFVHCESGALSTEPLPRGTFPPSDFCENWYKGRFEHSKFNDHICLN